MNVPTSTNDNAPKKVERPVPSSIATGEKRAAIPVKLLRLPATRDVVGENATDRIKGSPVGSTGKHWTINFIPALRHHEVMYFPSVPSDQVLVEYISEVGTSWIPL